MAEAGYPGQTGETPIGIFVPAGTPKAIVDLLHRKVVKMVAMPDVKQKLAAVGFAPIGDTPAEFAAYLKAEGRKVGQGDPRRRDQAAVNCTPLRPAAAAPPAPAAAAPRRGSTAARRRS